MSTKDLQLPKNFPMASSVMAEYQAISKATVGDPSKTVLTPANKEHALPETVVTRLNAMIEGDAAAMMTFESCAWHFQATGLENVGTFFKLLAGAARASFCQHADFLVKRGAMPSFGTSGSIPVVGPQAFCASSCADLTHASTLALAMAKTEFSSINALDAHAKGDAHLSDYLGNKARACSEKCRTLALLLEHCKTCSEVHGTGAGGGAGAAGITAAHLATSLLNRAMADECAFLSASVGAEAALPNRFAMGAFERATATASWAAAKPFMKAACASPNPATRSIVG